MVWGSSSAGGHRTGAGSCPWCWLPRWVPGGPWKGLLGGGQMCWDSGRSGAPRAQGTDRVWDGGCDAHQGGACPLLCGAPRPQAPSWVRLSKPPTPRTRRAPPRLPVPPRGRPHPWMTGMGFRAIALWSLTQSTAWTSGAGDRGGQTPACWAPRASPGGLSRWTLQRLMQWPLAS